VLGEAVHVAVEVGEAEIGRDSHRVREWRRRFRTHRPSLGFFVVEHRGTEVASEAREVHAAFVIDEVFSGRHGDAAFALAHSFRLKRPPQLLNLGRLQPEVGLSDSLAGWREYVAFVEQNKWHKRPPGT
jgi:hypothetical protein